MANGMLVWPRKLGRSDRLHVEIRALGEVKAT